MTAGTQVEWSKENGTVKLAENSLSPQRLHSGIFEYVDTVEIDKDALDQFLETKRKK